MMCIVYSAPEKLKSVHFWMIILIQPAGVGE